MKQFFANKYVQGITQYIKDEHFGPRDYIDWYCEQMGLSREEYMAGYRIAMDLRLAENKKPGPDPYHTGLDDKDVEDKEEQIKKQAEMDDDDPDAYKEMPGDKEAREKGKVKTSEFTKKYHELYGESESNESVVTEAVVLKKGDTVKFKNGSIIYILGPKGDGYDYRDGREKGHHSKEWFDMMISSGKAVVESVVTEGKMPDKYIGNDEIVFLKTKEDSRGANYNLYYKGHDIDAGGRRFGSEKELKDFAANYILSNQWYNKLRYADAKPLPESVDMDDLKNAKYRLKDQGVYKHLDIEYKQTRRGEKYVQIHYIPISRPQSQNPEWVNVRYDNAKDLNKISKELGMDLKESVLNEEKAEGDRSPIDNPDIEKALKKKADDTGVPIGILRIIMRRGMAAWKSGHRPGAGQEQWGYARVNAFLTKGEGTWGDADKDVAKEVRDGGHDKKLKKG